MISGWAVIEKDGVLNARTVCDHRRGAIVNWLVTKDVMVYNWMTDERIMELWNMLHKDEQIVEIKIFLIGENIGCPAGECNGVTVR